MKCWLKPAAAGAIGLIAGALTYAAAGPSLGLYLGGLAWAALLIPYLALGETRHSPAPGMPGEGWEGGLGSHLRRGLRLFPLLPFTLGLALIWLWSDTASIFNLIRCWLVLLAFSVAVGGVALGLCALVRSRVLAAALSVWIAALWLTWPIWLAHALQRPAGQTWTDRLIPLHPPLVLNGILAHLGVWAEHPLAYHLTNLGQDVFYTLPQSILPCLLLHLALGGAGMGIAWAVHRLLNPEP